MTAGGLSASFFVIIYSHTLDQMPFNKIVTIPIPWFTVGPDCNIYSTQEGYVTFVRGKYETKDNDSQDTSNNELNDDNDDIIIRIDTESNTQDDNTYSKESRVAKL